MFISNLNEKRFPSRLRSREEKLLPKTFANDDVLADRLTIDAIDQMRRFDHVFVPEETILDWSTKFFFVPKKRKISKRRRTAVFCLVLPILFFETIDRLFFLVDEFRRLIVTDLRQIVRFLVQRFVLIETVFFDVDVRIRTEQIFRPIEIRLL